MVAADVDDHAAGIFPDRQPEVLHLDFMGLRPGVATDRLRHAEDEKQFIKMVDGLVAEHAAVKFAGAAPSLPFSRK